MRRKTLAPALAAAAVLCASQWFSVVHAGFFVCPAPCEAMLLPRDMESLEDCQCAGNAAVLVDNANANAGGSLFRCPDGSAAQRLHPMSFADCQCLAGFTRDDVRKACMAPDKFKCTGRYRLKVGLKKAASVADCDCQPPYKKDEASGACALRTCPRAGNYVKKPRRKHVASLADCACVDPFTKNDQSGECLVEAPYECPAYAQPVTKSRPRSFADCHCDWGFVRTPEDTCARESAAFACPPHAVKRAGLGIGEPPRSFADCECENAREFRRNDELHACERRDKDVDGDGRDEIDEHELGDGGGDAYSCPPFARALARFPHAVAQCECLPGYGWKTPEMTCVPLSAYTCPLHAYKKDPALQAERSFSDCECARGYYRDDANDACLEWFLANDNGCPDFAFLRHWPLQSKANCQCIYGVATSDDETAAAATPAPAPATDKNEDNEEEDETPLSAAKKLRQRRATLKPQPLVRKKATQCNEPPAFFNVGFSQCPENAVATNWPLASSDDCTCKDGFEVLPISEEQFRDGDGEGFRCVDTAATITIADDDTATNDNGDEGEAAEEEPTTTTTCRSPTVKNPFTGECRLPVEQVRPRASTRAERKPARGSVVFKGIEYDYVVTEDDIMVIQGDVAIGELVAWPAREGQGEEVTTHVLHGYYNAERDHRWKDATMCYELDASAAPFASAVEDAMAHITSVTNFQFRKCRGNACAGDDACAHDFVVVKRTTSSCFSYVGRIGGRQLLGVSAECGLGNLMHVLLHAVGLRHTIDRADRDDHVRIAWECVPESRRSYFVVEDATSTSSNATTPTAAIDTPYDFFSIMHHPPGAFVSAATPWCQSVFPIIAELAERVAVMAKMGQRELLAVTDIHAVWKLYPTLQLADKARTYASDRQPHAAAGGKPSPPVFESRLHTQNDVVNTDPAAGELARRRGGAGGARSWGRKLGSFVGAMAMLTGFGAFVAFAVVEFRRRALLQGSGAYYSESLLADKALYD